MSTLTVRLPDDTHERLKELARHRGVSVNRLMEELSIIAITQHDAETRFRVLAARESVEEGCACSTRWAPHLAVSRVDESTSGDAVATVASELSSPAREVQYRYSH